MAKKPAADSDNVRIELIKASKEIADLKDALAARIKRSSDLLKENERLSKELEETKRQCGIWRQYYEKARGLSDINGDREAAMVVYGEADLSEIIIRK